MYTTTYCILIGFVVVYIRTLLIIALVFTIMFTACLKKIENNTYTLVDKAYSSTDRVSTLFHSITTNMNNTGDIYSTMDNVDTTFNSLDASVSIITSAAGSIDSEISSIGDILNSLKPLLDAMHSRCGDDCPVPLPDSSAIPDLSGLTDKIHGATDTIGQVKSQSDSVKSTVGTVKTSMDDALQGSRSTIDNLVSTYNEPIEAITSVLGQYEDIYLKAKRVSTGLDTTRIVVFLAFYVYVLVFLVLALIGVIYGRNWSPRLAACCTFFTPIVFLFIASVQLVLFVGLTDIHREVEHGLRYNVDQHASGLYRLNGSELVNKILYCSVDGSVFDLVTDYMNVTSLADTSSQIAQTNKNINSLNVGAKVNETIGYLDFNLTAIISSTNLEAKISGIQTELATLIQLSSNISAFGFPEKQAQEALQELNDNSKAIGGDLFVYENITDLDPTSSPYNQNQNYFTNKKQELLEYKSQRDKLQKKIDDITSDIPRVATSLNTVIIYFNLIYSDVSDIDNQIEFVKSQISTFPDLVEDIRVSLVDYLAGTSSTVLSLWNEVIEQGNCHYVKQYYTSTIDNIGKLGGYSGVICLTVYLITLFELIWFLLLLPATKRIGNIKHVKPEHDKHQI
jgi:fumarate reductase subunit D